VVKEIGGTYVTLLHKQRVQWKAHEKCYGKFHANLKVQNQIQTIKLLGLSAKETSTATVFIFQKF
jgi:hypothetical protein